jgi:hypothetical protein
MEGLEPQARQIAAFCTEGRPSIIAQIAALAASTLLAPADEVIE